MRRMHLSLCAAVVALLVTSPAMGQKFSLELRGGAGFPTAELGDADLDTGAGFGLTGAFRFLPHMMAYGGWDWFMFGTEELVPNNSIDVETTGYAFGLQFQHPVYGRTAGWVKAGGIYNHIEVEDDEGDVLDDTGHELGWEAGAGLSIPIGQRFALNPGVRYRTFSADLELNGTPVPVDLSYLTAEIGFAWTIGGQAVNAARVR